jgi:hypothetical protein
LLQKAEAVDVGEADVEKDERITPLGELAQGVVGVFLAVHFPPPSPQAPAQNPADALFVIHH